MMSRSRRGGNNGKPYASQERLDTLEVGAKKEG